MNSPAPARTAPSKRLPLLAYADGNCIAAWRRAERVSAGQMLGDALRTAQAMPESRHVLNLCADRYHFTVALLAAILRGQTTLMPPSTTPNVIAAMKAFAPSAYCICDDVQLEIDLPRFELPPGGAAIAYDVPQVDAQQDVACLFTSGSTGEPQPYFKRWGSMVQSMRAEAKRFGIGPGHAVIGTVPSQHMYGFESTVLLPIICGAALTSERPYYPADIDAAITQVPAPCVLISTPFHLRTWMESGDPAKLEAIVSATAPLSMGLARQVEERTGAKLHEIYGCTETGQVASRRPSQGVEWETFEGIRVALEGAQAMASGGHIEQPTPLQDVIEVLGDGSRFILHGRTSDMVNIAGKRNSLGYLNHQLTSIEGVTDGVFFLPDDEGDEGITRLTAFVVAPTLTASQVLEALRARLDPAFLPRPIVMVPVLPRALTGKLPREALRTLAEQARAQRAKGP